MCKITPKCFALSTLALLVPGVMAAIVICGLFWSYYDGYEVTSHRGVLVGTSVQYRVGKSSYYEVGQIYSYQTFDDGEIVLANCTRAASTTNSKETAQNRASETLMGTTRTLYLSKPKHKHCIDKDTREYYIAMGTWSTAFIFAWGVAFCILIPPDLCDSSDQTANGTSIRRKHAGAQIEIPEYDRKAEKAKAARKAARKAKRAEALERNRQTQQQNGHHYEQPGQKIDEDGSESDEDEDENRVVDNAV